ncbi:MAG: hypothetical protein IPM71_03835 [Bacteroidota bacterium]|nr:MAG: hypothetical protein IPM71_03835 [Bacteroidota bacterium]
MKTIKILAIAILLTMGMSCENLLNDLTDEQIALELEGQWTVDESSSIFKAAMQSQTVFISVSESDPTQILIENFYGLGNNSVASARVNGYTLQLLNNQSLDNDFTLVQGSGTINKNLNVITWNYSIDDGSGEVDQVQATYTILD